MKNINKIYITIIVALCAIIYSNTLNSPFHFDDNKNIKNPSLTIESGTVDEFKNALLGGVLRTRPVSNMSFALNYYIGGYRVQGYHLVNIVIHIICGIILYYIILHTLYLSGDCYRYKNAKIISLIATLLWIAHPLATQSVTYIVQRMNSMASMFYILSLLLYICARISQFDNENNSSVIKSFSLYFSCIISGLLSLGSKEIAVTLPVVIFIYEWYFFQRLSGKWLRKRFIYLIAIAALIIVYAYVHLGDNPWRVFYNECSSRAFTSFERLLTQPRVILTYISLLFYPIPERMALDYNISFSTGLFNPISTFYCIIALSLLFLLSIFVAKRNRLISFCILWFFITLSVESSVICLELAFEHRTYLPSMMFWLLMVTFVYQYLSNKNIVLLFIPLIIVFGVWTYERNEIWKSPISLWRSNLLVFPENARTHANLGLAYMNANDLENAESHLRKAITLSPFAPMPLTNIGKLYLLRGDKELAEEYFRKAIRYNPDYITALYRLGVLLREENRYEEAVVYFKKALLVDPKFQMVNQITGYALINKQLGNVLLRSGRSDEALQYLKAAYDKASLDKEVLLDYSEALVNIGDYQKAIELYQDVIDIDKSSVSAHFNLALIYQQIGDVENAIVHYREAYQYNIVPEGLEYNYGNQLFKSNRLSEAENIYKKYLETEIPVILNTLNNIGLLYLNQSRVEEAINCFKIILSISPDHELAKGNLQNAYKQLELKK